MAPQPIPTVTETDLLDFHAAFFGHPFAGKELLGRHLHAEAILSNEFAAHQNLDKAPEQSLLDGEADTAREEAVKAEADGHGNGDEQYGEGYEYEEEDDDGLGYYDDGVKRTLTDAQIEMFRHSEIQQLLRARRIARENADDDDDDDNGEMAEDNPDASTQHIDNAPGCEDGKGQTRSGQPRDASEDERGLQRGVKRQRISSPAPGGGDDDDEDTEAEEREYARFLRAERVEFERVAAARRNGESETYDADDRTISTRRRVREMDAMQTDTATLMYDDDCGNEDKGVIDVKAGNPTEKSAGAAPDEAIAERSVDQTAKGGREGRKIWWPEIRART